MSFQEPARFFYASTPQPSPPSTPPNHGKRKSESKNTDQTLLKALRISIEQRNFPKAMEVIRKMEKFEHEYEKLRNMEKLENRLLAANQIASDRLQQVNILKKETNTISELVNNLKLTVSTCEKDCDVLRESNSTLKETCAQLSTKCIRMAQTLSSREITNAQNSTKMEIELNHFRKDNLEKCDQINLTNVRIRKINDENITLVNRCNLFESDNTKLLKENSKLKLMLSSYKSELNNLSTEANQKSRFQTQQNVGNVLLERIEELLSKKTVSGEFKSETKKLEKRKQAVTNYLDSMESNPRVCPLPSIPHPIEIEKKNDLFLETAANSDVDVRDIELKTDLDNIEVAIKKLEASLS